MAAVEQVVVPEQDSARAKIVSRGVNVHYGDNHALQSVDLEIFVNEVVSLIGPSGCGKSTFLRCLNRMNDVIEGCRVEGEISLDGTDIYDSALDVVQLRARVGMVFQKPNPLSQVGLRQRRLRPAHPWPRGVQVRTRRHRRDQPGKGRPLVRSQDRLSKPGTGLSGGQQQRLCIARAIAVNPEVILMDEPCSASTRSRRRASRS